MFGCASKYGDGIEYSFDPQQMQEPYFSLAFLDDTTHPITHVPVDPEDWKSAMRPVYYAEFVGLPTIESVDSECNPVV